MNCVEIIIVFDEQFDEILIVFNEEVKLRDSDLLVIEDDIFFIYVEYDGIEVYRIYRINNFR